MNVKKDIEIVTKRILPCSHIPLSSIYCSKANRNLKTLRFCFRCKFYEQIKPENKPTIKQVNYYPKEKGEE